MAKATKKRHQDDNTSVTDGSVSVATDNTSELLHEVMTDNLDLMLEIVLRVREDEDFARSIYADCPRLQHLLDQNPDLRPIFEDPNLVRINFEQVYRKAGGTLPEDKPPMYKKVLVCIVNHPLFKVFRFLLLIKKLYSCVVGGGFGMIKNCLVSMFSDGAADAIADNVNAEDLLETNVSPESLANKEALNKVADHMEEPEVREQMHLLLESDPEQLDEAIEQDPELKMLRESNPLCAELMNDPTTMKILVDPDNLRALGECPDLIEADFSNPDWSPPDVESVPFDDLAGEGMDEFVDAEGGPEIEGEEGEGGEGGDGEDGEEEEEEGFVEEFERGDETEGKAANKKQDKKKDDKKKDGQGGGFFSTIGTGLVDYIAAETIGVTASEMMGGDDDFGVEDLEDEVLDEAEEAADGTAETLATQGAAMMEVAASDDVTGQLEDTMDNAEDAEGDESKEDKAAAAAENAATAGVVMVGGAGGKSEGESTARSGADDEEEDESEEEKPKKSRMRRFGSKIGGGLGALSSAAKEYAIGAVLGEDLAEELVEKIEEESDSEDEDGKDKKNASMSSKLASSFRFGGSSSRFESTSQLETSMELDDEEEE